MSDLADNIDRTRIPPSLLEIGECLIDAGHQAFLVGGCLRDLLRGASPYDWDLATSALPHQVAGLFPRTVPTGERFGTMSVLKGEVAFEVTTLRQDVGYSDRRHPDRVVYTDDIELDLRRRDFTINAIAVDLASWRFHDPAAGVDDLDRRCIRAVGDPEERFREDALRLMRACRLAAQLDFEIDGATAAAMRTAAPSIVRIAIERVRDELLKLLQRAERPSTGLRLMIDAGLLDHIMPELLEGDGVTQNRYHRHDVLQHSLLACDRAPRERPLVRLAALLHDVAKPRTRAGEEGEATFYEHDALGTEISDAILRRLHVSNADRADVIHLVRHHMFQYGSEWSDAAVRRFIRRVGEERLEDLFTLRQADADASGRDCGRQAELGELRRRIAGELEDGGRGYQRRLAIGGGEVMETLGLTPGPAIGAWLERLEEAVLERPELNTAERLIDLLRRWAADETDS